MESQDLLPDEDAASLQLSTAITVTAAAGQRLQALVGPYAGAPPVQMNLTDTALLCVSDAGSQQAAPLQDIVVNAFALRDVPHSACSLNASTPISAAMVFTVHTKTAVAKLQAGDDVPLQTLTSASACVQQAVNAADNSQQQQLSRRRLSNDGDATTSSAAAVAWTPLAVLSIPHARTLSAVEQRNFSTACRVWNAATSAWDSEICLKDDALSSATATACVCSRLGRLEVVVTLEERLDFYARDRELYRDDAPSVLGPVWLALLLATLVGGSAIGRRLDIVDARRAKEQTIKGLNRSKWSELLERTTQPQTTGAQDFAAFLAERQRLQAEDELSKKQPSQQQSTTLKEDEKILATVASSVGTTETASTVVKPLLEMTNTTITATAIDTDAALPHEARTLFASSASLARHFAWLTTALRVASALLFVLGVLVALVGVDFMLVLGQSTSEIVLLLYGRSLGLVAVVFGGVLVLVGAVGALRLSRESASHRARDVFRWTLVLVLLAELLVVQLAFRGLEDLDELPHGAVDALRRAWTSLSLSKRDELQTTYGCCGFASVADSSQDRLACPEEALDATPARVCLDVVLQRARALFGTSFRVPRARVCRAAGCASRRARARAVAAAARAGARRGV
ncbi:hypothetical protein PINS_up005464 [Pythium insidiosum]|nr:hypothetical protein PINS_up005464 [Pythium insidiosum]